MILISNHCIGASAPFNVFIITFQLRDGFLESDTVLGRYCSSYDPAPVLTTGPYGQVVFHSDESENDIGFHITYAAIASK